MDNVIHFPGRTTPAGGTAPDSTTGSMERDVALEATLERWKARAVFALPPELTLQTSFEGAFGIPVSRVTTDTETQRLALLEEKELLAVLDGLLVHCVECLSGQGGVLSLSATRLHQPQAQELSYRGLAAGEYALLLFSADGSDATRSPVVLSKHVIGAVQAFGGAVDSSDQGEFGLRVALHLPVGEPSAGVALQQGNTGSLAAMHEEPLHVVLVDDDNQARQVLTRLLQKLGCTVTAFAEGGAALDALSRTPDTFALVLSDMTMPRMSGAELAERVRDHHATIPVALMTGFAATLEEEALIALGVLAVLKKPFGAKALQAVIDAVRAASDG